MDYSQYSHTLNTTNLIWGTDYLVCDGTQTLEAQGLPTGNVLQDGVSFSAWVKLSKPSSLQTWPLLNWPGVLSCEIEANTSYKHGVVKWTVQTSAGTQTFTSEQCVTYDQWVYLSMTYQPGSSTTHGLTVWVGGTTSEAEKVYVEHAYGTGDITVPTANTTVQLLWDGTTGFVGDIRKVRLGIGADAIDQLNRYWIDGNIDGSAVTAQPDYISSVDPTMDKYSETRWITGQPVATFESVGVTLFYNGDSDANSFATIRYRIDGGTWETGNDLVADRASKSFRGSIFEVPADSTVEIECTLTDPNEQNAPDVVVLTVDTWADTVTEGVTKTATVGMTISDKGTASNWVVYTANGVLDAGTTSDQVITVYNASYVILRGLTLKGGNKHAILVINSDHIRIEGSDISDWGVAGVLNQQKIYVDPNNNNEPISNKQAIYVGRGCRQLVVQNNLFHAPRGDSNTWLSGVHPAGPQAIVLNMTEGNHVIRYNDFIGDTSHWWNDAITSASNSSRRGGPYRDTDIYGNIIAFSADDGFELDGGQINVRVWNNWVTRTFVGISAAPTRFGPSYVWRNIITDMGDRDNGYGNGLKLGGDEFVYPGLISLWHNTVVARGSAMQDGHYGTGPTPVISRNNVYLGSLDNNVGTMSDLDYDLILHESLLNDPTNWETNGLIGVVDFLGESSGDWHLDSGTLGIDAGVALGSVNAVYSDSGPDLGALEGQTAEAFPIRPNGINVSVNKIKLRYVKGQPVAQGTVDVTLPTTAGTTWQAIVEGDWFTCTPVSGSGTNTQTVTVTANATGLETRWYDGSISFRSNTGIVRTVFVRMQVYDTVPQVVSMEAETMTRVALTEGTDSQAYGGKYIFLDDGFYVGSLSSTFTITQAGDYYISASCMVDGSLGNPGGHDSWYVRVDNTEDPIVWVDNDIWDWSGYPNIWNWQPVIQRANPQMPMKVTLSAGTHTIDFGARQSLALLDRVTISDQPYADDLVMIEFEAEDGVNSGFTVVTDAAASGGKYLECPNWLVGSVTFTFTVPVTGTYYVNAMIMTPAPGALHNSFFVEMDGGKILWDVAESENSWQWDLARERNALLPKAYLLTAGTHTLEVRGREALTRIDKLFISNLPYID
ncbi:MAG: hypothetical protein L3J71_18130 [Victivallaceae bacterium]|nr:hypothetical protein [Victivallaceae bacterium]